MSAMEYNNARRCISNSLSYPEYYYDGYNEPRTLSQNARTKPRNYFAGGYIGGIHGQFSTGRDEHSLETGSARRRIAVACARCRKRKIRCSGDPGNGTGCTNCRQASLDPARCQFHRVGSDNVHKVIDSLNTAQSLTNMANLNRMVPIYSASNSLYPRPMPSQPYPPLDTKSMYHSSWTVPYPEDTSPVDTYVLDHSNMYRPNPLPMTNTTVILSSLNGPSLQLNLPERPCPQEFHASEPTIPQRQLPIPQPSSAQTSRNVVDRLQDQRLRSARAGAPAGTRTSSAKSTLPWSADGDNQIHTSDATIADGHLNITAQLHNITESAIAYIPTTTLMPDDVKHRSTAEQIHLNFNTSTFVEAISTPAPATPYSHFRERRTPAPSSTQMARQDSETNLYNFDSNYSSKRLSLGKDLSNDRTLVRDHHYTPAMHS
ncbi:hypothetical protein BKA66DRAFT_601175 [Pyrenochaeta sp. MPI-SDFR-AT-0127]|nr:hypothetical protein BKA66DRAFT_601175 [Pyrenochaeta sp. MPI-SDFR-AT-0127]